MKRYERYGHIGERGLIHVRENTGEDRTGRTVYRNVAVCSTEDDAATIVDALNQLPLLRAIADAAGALNADHEPLYAHQPLGLVLVEESDIDRIQEAWRAWKEDAKS